MKQPDLGKKILALRKQKGITQEELVAKCNVTVRTIQRIESGDVTPRPSTLRLIVEALEYDWNNFSNALGEESAQPSQKPRHWISRIFPFDDLYYEDFQLMRRDLRLAWIAGIVYFIAGFPESAMEFLMIESESLLSGSWYSIVKAIVLVSFIFFIRGFIIIGFYYKNTLLTFSAWLYLFVVVVDYSIAIFSSYDATTMMEVPVARGLIYGFTAVFFGIALYRMRATLGDAAHYAGLLELAVGISFLTLILFMVGMVLMIPAELLEIYLLFRLAERLKSNVGTEI